jgi:hypothetical protein
MKPDILHQIDEWMIRQFLAILNFALRYPFTAFWFLGVIGLGLIVFNRYQRRA